MKISKAWLKELVELKVPFGEVESLLPLRTIGLKEVTQDYIELDMKGYNRADLLSLRGVSYEISAITNSGLNFIETNIEEILRKWSSLPKVKVSVDNPRLAPLYLVAKIEGLTTKNSPQDWQDKLISSGMRPVNNIADITNLVMLEYGQPLHAFDCQMTADETIIVRIAKEGEKITTLDNKDRVLASTDLVIADPEKALGLAGVMGGKNSEVGSNTSSILLEAAIFDPKTIRNTVQKHNLPSDASKRFQHGLTKKRLIQALDAAIRMYRDLGGKLAAVTIIGDLAESSPKIILNKQKLDSLIGIELDPLFVEESLRKLHFKVKDAPIGTSLGWEVTPPYFRLDVTIEEDVIEEAARMYGYEKIPAKELPLGETALIDQRYFDLVKNIKEMLINLGLTEVQTYPYYSTQVISALELDLNNLVKIANPMSKETTYLRENIWPNLIQALALNFNKYRISDQIIFEIGKTYKDVEGQTPKEETILTITALGEPQEGINKLITIYHQVIKLLQTGPEVSKEKITGINQKLFYPNGLAVIEDSKGEQLGLLAVIHPRVTDQMGLSVKASILEINLSPLYP